MGQVHIAGLWGIVAAVVGAIAGALAQQSFLFLPPQTGCPSDVFYGMIYPAPGVENGRQHHVLYATKRAEIGITGDHAHRGPAAMKCDGGVMTLKIGPMDGDERYGEKLVECKGSLFRRQDLPDSWEVRDGSCHGISDLQGNKGNDSDAPFQGRFMR